MTSTDHADALTDGDFVRIEYTARAVESGHVVDTTDPAVAADADIDGLDADGPIVIVLGEEHVFEPIEETIRSIGISGSTTVTVDPDDAFGERDPNKRETVPTSLVPADRREAGRTVSVAGRECVIESVNDETAHLDYNHSLAGVTLEYDLSVGGRVTGRDRVEGLRALHGLDAEAVVSDDQLSISITATDPSQERDRRLRAFIGDARRFLPVEEVSVTESYSG
ncbi:FKBP-type peptidyl-prolyl cis-trans isomerase [Halorubrum kocurii]|uniref:Peptidyl-prolyl cis-trans isomerase n=1 Tax=Halorubrum kocurii JCM 14978 TaxID=1230456 RepID=M0PI43_9EURY|nr:FKBP-type peptidyl-prolyl cis-trans isomerase [Halorubrum kocurii]EMA69284.1 FKBP-type peptidylprolyl isomerase [Halorubrum kocurii JCM 14978]